MMGMYTQLALNLWLVGTSEGAGGSNKGKPMPPELVRYLTEMSDDSMWQSATVPPDFAAIGNRASWMLRSGGSYYFDGGKVFRFGPLDDICGCHPFTLWTDIKNYDGEWERLLAYLSPFVEAAEGDCLGTYRYEEYQTPNLVVYRGGALRLVQIVEIADAHERALTDEANDRAVDRIIKDAEGAKP